MTINNNDIQIIEERLQSFWDTFEGQTLKKVLEEQTKTIQELETKLEKKIEESNSEKEKTIENLKKTIEELKSKKEEEWLKFLQKVFGEAIKDGKFVGSVARSTEPTEPQTYLLTDLIDETELKKIIESEEKRWKMKKKEPLTSKFLNEFLGVEPDPDPEKNEEDLNEWLKERGGFEVPREIAEKEEKLSKAEKGTYQLPYFYEMNDNFDPAKPTFCSNEFTLETMLDKNGEPIVKNGREVKERVLPKLYLSEDDRRNKKINSKAIQGNLAFGTGVGKTTKIINCLVRGGERNVILVAPNSALVSGAYNDHIDWLQDWKCVYCGKKHGEYKVSINKIVEGEDGEFGNGLSILEPRILVGYLDRTLVDNVEMNKRKITSLTEEKLKEYKEKISQIKSKETKEYLENSIIVFDEAHVGHPSYKQLIKKAILSGYKVIKMSATFEGRGFSLTSSYQITTKYMKGFTKDMDEKFAKTKTLLFLKSTEDRFEKRNQTSFNGLTKKQKEMLENSGIASVILNKNYESSAVGISEGLDEGSLIIVNPDYEMGYTFDVGIVISKNELELSRLLPTWTYDTPKTYNLPFASMQQQRGRVGRIGEGTAIFLSKKTEEKEIEDDAASAYVRILLTEKEYEDELEDLRNDKKLKDLLKHDLQRMKEAVAFPDHFGKEPEEILIGWNTKITDYTVFLDNLPTGKQVDESLWDRHLGKKKEVKIDEVSAKEILKLMIANYLKKQKDFPRKVNIEFDNDLIKLTKLKKEEVHEVLNTIINDKLKEFFKKFNKEYDSNLWSFKSQEVRDKIADFHLLKKDVDITIDYDVIIKPAKKNSKGDVKVPAQTASRLKIFYEAKEAEVEM